MGALREDLEGAARAFGTFKMWVATIVSIGGGGFFLLTPADSWPEDTPRYLPEVAGGVLLFFGLCFLANLAGPPSLAFRARAAALLVATVALLGFFAWAFFPAFKEAWVLQRVGVAAQGQIERPRIYHTDRSGPWHTVLYEGRRKKLRLSTPRTNGEQIPLLVHPEDLDVMTPGQEGDHLITLLGLRLGLTWTLAAVLIAALCAISSPFLLARMISGPPKDRTTA